MRWISFSAGGAHQFGLLRGDLIEIYEGDMFDGPTPTGRTANLEAVKVEIPCRPSKMIALWNNSRSIAAAQSLEIPTQPLFFIKPGNCYAAHDDEIIMPAPGAGRIVYEAELGIVIGKRCKDVSEDAAAAAIFGYTCVNDLTALPLLPAEAGFTHWSRAKGLDGFGPFGPVIATGLDPANLTITTLVNGRERQRYSTNDLILSPLRIVSMISRGMTLFPGDIIACGTSGTVGPVPRSGQVEVEVEGVGILRTHFRALEKEGDQ